MKVKRYGIIMIVIALVAVLGISVYATQIYTGYTTASSVSAQGSLYGYKVDDYIRIAASTTYASGSVDYYVETSTTLYANGTHSDNASGTASSGVSAQSGQVIMTASDNVTSIGSSHSAKVYAATEVNIPLANLSLNIDEID